MKRTNRVAGGRPSILPPSCFSQEGQALNYTKEPLSCLTRKAAFLFPALLLLNDGAESKGSYRHRESWESCLSGESGRAVHRAKGSRRPDVPRSLAKS